MPDSPNADSNPSSPAHTVTYDSAATHSDSEEREQPENQLGLPENQESPRQTAEDDVDTSLKTLCKNGQLVDFTKKLISEQRDLEDAVQHSCELLKVLQNTIINLQTQLRHPKNTVHRVDILMTQLHAVEDSSEGTSSGTSKRNGKREWNDGGSSSDSTSGKRQRV